MSGGKNRERPDNVATDSKEVAEPPVEATETPTPTEAAAAAAPVNHRRLLIFDNPEKKGHRPAGPHEAAPNWPFRLLLSGPPGSGKRNLYLNLIFQLLEPPPSAIHIIHFDPHTIELQELETLGVPMYYYDAKDFPTVENLMDPEPPRIGEHQASSASGEDPLEEPVPGNYGECPLVIIDECTDETLPLESRCRLERLLNYGSTHHNTSVICSIQSLLSIPPRARRAFDHYALWPQSDRTVNKMAALRAGIPGDLLQELFQLCEGRHDSIWIDTSRPLDDPYRFRLNMLWPITASSAVDYGDY